MFERGKHKVVLEPDPAAERIFAESMLGRKGIRTIADDLNREGISSPRGDRRKVSSTWSIVDNPKYTGHRGGTDTEGRPAATA